MAENKSILITGAGIIGIASAYYLQRAGYRVTLVDRGKPAAACSHGNCGYVCPSHVLPLTEPSALPMALRSFFRPKAPFRVKFRWSPALWKWMVQFALRCHEKQMLAAGQHLKAILDSSMSEYQRLVREENLSCEWTTTGLLYVLRSPAALEAFGKSDAFLSQHFGVAARRIEGRELPDFDPAIQPGLAGAYLYEEDCSVRPDRLASSWVEILKQQGVQVLENHEVRQVSRNGGRILGVETSQGALTADHYLFSVGSWSRFLEKELDCSLPVEPGKGYSVTMKSGPGVPRHSMLFPERKVGVTPFQDGWRLGSMMEFVGHDTSIPDWRILQLKQAAVDYLVQPETGDELERWYGWRPMTWDSLPILGRLPRLENGWVATGHNMLGVSLASGTGRLMAEMIAGEKPHLDVSAFSPSRF